MFEKRKAGYCNIVKFKIGDNLSTDPKEIRKEMSSFYQNIYNAQPVQPKVNDIEQFLKSDNDIKPWKTLQDRKIPEKQQQMLSCLFF